MDKQKDIRLTFSNYNYAFNNFYENYKDTCLALAEKTKVSQLGEVRRLVTTFVSEYEYAIDDKNIKERYHIELTDLRLQMGEDEELTHLGNKDFEIISNKIQYAHKYYEYFLKYLDIFGRYISELTETFMPNTNIQRKVLKFSNNQAFFEKFTLHKKEVLDSMAEFKIFEFSTTYNHLLTFYYAYNLFINQEARKVIERIFSSLISYYLHRDNLNLLMEKEPSIMQHKKIADNTNLLSEGLLYINSLMNHSFSNYDVLPKIQKKVYEDRTLI